MTTVSVGVYVYRNKPNGSKTALKLKEKRGGGRFTYYKFGIVR
jgi:hypothetical protein